MRKKLFPEYKKHNVLSKTENKNNTHQKEPLSNELHSHGDKKEEIGLKTNTQFIE
jgi:hypothetical protein